MVWDSRLTQGWVLVPLSAIGEVVEKTISLVDVEGYAVHT